MCIHREQSTEVLHAASIWGAWVVVAASSAAAGGSEELKLVAPDGAAEDQLGVSIALRDGIAAVGALAHQHGAVRSGAVYLYDADSGRLLHELLPDDGAEWSSFGGSIAIANDRVLVGAAHDDDLGHWSGSAYLYAASSGQRLLKLLADDGAADDGFGASVAIEGDTLLVGSPGDDDGGGFTGAAYVFDARTGLQTAKLLPASVGAGAKFGSAVAISGGLAAVGAPGQLQPGVVYVLDLETRSQVARLVAADGVAGDGFGSRLAIRGDLVVVGASSAQPSFPYQGAAYAFDARTGDQLAKLTAHGGAPEQAFGISVAIDGDRILVGSRNGVGAYLFDARTLLQIGRFRGSDAAPGDGYGVSVAIEGARALVGARWQDAVGERSGAAYVHDVETALAVPYCFGDGSGTPCPCGNDGAHGRGCANGADPAGATLFAPTAPRVSAEVFYLRVAGSAPDQLGIFFQASGAVAGGLGAPFGDGLRCAAGNELRLEVTAADPTGWAITSGPLAATGGVVAGDVRTYQWWYRDPNGSPCGAGVNLSNGLEITWGE